MSLQLYLFVFFAGMLLLDQTLGKPLKSLILEDGGHESNHAVNETSEIREKRDLSDCSRDTTLKELCPPNNVYLHVSPGNDCEKGWYMCFGYREAVCKDTFSWTLSPACDINIRNGGSPRCSPVLENVTIHTGECVKRTSHCSC